MVNITQNIVSSSKYSLKCPNAMNPVGICVHNTANDAAAKGEISYMISNTSQTSFHFAVDDIEAVQGLPLDRNGWHAGDGNGDGNRKHIGIEICYSKSGGDRFNKAEENAAELIAQLLKERGWGIDRVKKHQDFSGKYCPHRTLDLGWDRFLGKIQNKMGGITMPADWIIQNSDKWRGLVIDVLALGNPEDTPLDKVKSVIAGLKSRATDMENQKTYWETEAKNREEQVGRLKDQLLEEQNLRKDLSSKLTDALANAGGVAEVYEKQLTGKQVVIDDQGKKLGEASHTIADLEAQLKAAKTKNENVENFVQKLITFFKMLWEKIQKK